MNKYIPAKAEGMHNSGLATKNEDAEHSMTQYWPIKSELTMNDGIAMKCERIIIPFQLWKQILQQMCSNHMGIEKARLQACEWYTV